MLDRWIKNEPVRTYLWGLVTPALALATAYGFLSEDLALGWGGLAAAALLVPVGAAVRNKVTPTDPTV